MALKFVGNARDHYLAGVPARDLTDEDIAEVIRVEGATYPNEKAILASGLYEAVAKPAASKDDKEGKE